MRVMICSSPYIYAPWPQFRSFLPWYSPWAQGRIARWPLKLGLRLHLTNTLAQRNTEHGLRLITPHELAVPSIDRLTALEHLFDAPDVQSRTQSCYASQGAILMRIASDAQERRCAQYADSSYVLSELMRPVQNDLLGGIMPICPCSSSPFTSSPSSPPSPTPS